MAQPIRFVLLQCLAALFVVVAHGQWPACPLWLVLAGGGALAGFVAWFWQDGRWWCLFHLTFPLAVGFALTLQIDSSVWLGGFVLLFLFSAGAIRSRVPLYLSNQRTLALLNAEIPANAKLIDLGAGTGTVLAWLSKNRPDVQLTGVEVALMPWLIGRLRLGAGVDWRRGNAFNVDLAGFDVVYAYLSPEPMTELWQKVRAECGQGSRFISNSFAIPGVAPDKTIDIGDWKNSKLLIWQST